MTIAIALLMKDPAESKSRLSPVLGDDARSKLAIVLFENALRFFGRQQDGGPLAVVTQSRLIAEIANAEGVAVVFEDGAAGINAAAERAALWAAEVGADALLIVHADLPVLLDSEFALLMEKAKNYSVVVAESVDGGTNAILVSPPDAIDFHFGPNSASAHENAAAASGRSVTRLRLDWLARDVDTPGDLLCKPAPREAGGVRLLPVAGICEIEAGQDLATAILVAMASTNAELRPGDILVVAQKVVSKSEGRMVNLDAYQPSPEATTIAYEIGKDARKVEAILRESSEVLRKRRQAPDGLLVTRHRQGWVCANAGIDESNLGPGSEGLLLLLPEDPDASAVRIRKHLELNCGARIGVIITDTFGRPWRQGLVNVAIGVAGVPMIVDWTQKSDAYGRELRATLPAFADEVAAAAGLVMLKDAGIPAVIVRGLDWLDTDAASARDVLRPISEEVFL